MNHMITDDPGTSSYSPHFAGSHCIHCGKQEEINERGECEKCETSACFLCAEMVTTTNLKTVRGKDVCHECIDYNGIEVVKDLVQRFNLKIERGLRMQSENKVAELQQLIKNNCKPVLTL